MTIGRTWDNMSLDLEERDAIFVEGPEKDRLLKQNINLIEILGQPLYEKWLEQIQPNEKECLDIIVTQIICDIVDQGTTLEVKYWENLKEDAIRLQYEKTKRPDNAIVQRDSIEIVFRR